MFKYWLNVSSTQFLYSAYGSPTWTSASYSSDLVRLLVFGSITKHVQAMFGGFVLIK